MFILFMSFWFRYCARSVIGCCFGVNANQGINEKVFVTHQTCLLQFWFIYQAWCRDWTATSRRFYSGLWQSIADACGVGVRTCGEYFKRSQLRRYTSPSLGVVTVRLSCDYVGGRRVAEQIVRARSILWNCRLSWKCVQKGNWNS